MPCKFRSEVITTLRALSLAVITVRVSHQRHDLLVQLTGVNEMRCKLSSSLLKHFCARAGSVLISSVVLRLITMQDQQAACIMSGCVHLGAFLHTTIMAIAQMTSV